MVKDDPERTPRQAPESGRRAGGRGPFFKLAALGLAVATVATATGFLMAPWLRPQEAPAPATPSPQPQEAPRLFRKWPEKLDLALVLSAQQHGYLQPCGCSEPQKGGLARRYNFIQSLKQRGWPVVAADLGDIIQPRGPQALLKYRYSMTMLNRLNYAAVSVGENEIAWTLVTLLGEYALNTPSPRVLAANATDANKAFPAELGLAAAKVSDGQNGAPRIGFIGVIGPSLAKAVQDPDIRFKPADDVLAGLVARVQPKADLLVLLYQGSLEEAKACARKHPQFAVILCLSEEDEPSSRPDRLNNTLIVSVGHKGRYVGVVGVSRTGQPAHPFALRYELVALDPEFETPEGQDATNPIHALMQQYAEEVKDGKYLAKYAHDARHPVQIDFPDALYVGSEKCKRCHTKAYQIWKDHPHSHAHDTLVHKARRPTLRQYDGECVICHVTGFSYKGGFLDNDKLRPSLANVGCESCHGPASLHVKDPDNALIRAALNPMKAKPGEDPALVANRMNDSCRKCHDLDNSVHFNFQEYWIEKKTVHKNKKTVHKSEE